MKKSLLTLAISSALVSPFTFAGNDSEIQDSSALTTEVMVVTANRTSEDKFNVLAAVDVFDHQAIAQMQPRSVADLLSRVAGISVTTQGGEAHQSSVFIRGSNSDHVLVLVDGIRVGSATLGEKNLGDLPLQLIERIEIIRGPRAAQWGSDAIGGVIQIFTRRLANDEAQLGVKFGSHNLWQGYGAIGLGNEQHQYTLSASKEASQGFDVITPDPANPFAVDQSDKDGYHKEALALSGSSQLSERLRLDVAGQYNQGMTEIDASYSGDENHYKNHQLMLNALWQLAAANLTFTLGNSADNTWDNADKLFGSDKNRYKTTRQQASALVELPLSDATQLLAGIDWYREKISSNADYAKRQRDASAVFITGRHEIARLKLEASLRRDNVGDTDGENSYQLAAGYQLNEHWLLALTKGTAFKAPTFNDLYWPEAFGSAGNPDLLSETADSLELLTRYQRQNTTVQLSLYQSDFSNLIEWAAIDPKNAYSGWQPSNISSAKVKGAELTVQTTVAEVQHSLTLSHIDAKNNLTGQQLARRPYFSADYNIDYQFNDWQLSLDISHQGKRLDSNGLTLASHTLLNISASYQFNAQLSLTGKITNVANREYFQLSEYPGDERGYTLALDYRF